MSVHILVVSIHSVILFQAFIDFLPKYIGMTRPEQEESMEKGEETDGEDTPMRIINGRQPGGEYFFRKINPDLVLPWRGR